MVLVQRRAASAHAAPTAEGSATAGAATGATWGLAPVASRGRAFRIRHRSLPPFDWALHLVGQQGDILLSLPSGLPWAQDESRVTHPIDPEDADAAGGAPIWDEGAYRTESADGQRAVLVLEGTRVRGRYALERVGERVTLRRLDPASARPFPDRILPMLAHAASYPEHPDQFAFEPKWDGVRAVAYLDRGRLTLRSRNLNDITAQYPELQGLAEAYADRQLVLDGEIVAPDDSGRPSFQRLQNRMGVVQRGLAKTRAESHPIVYVVFDLLYADGHDMMARPYEERRASLAALALHGDAWRTAPMQVGDGRDILAMPEWEGVVAKRLGSPYEPGARSRAWIKIKRQNRQELVIGGWTAGRGARAGQIGALLVGYYDTADDASSPLRYAGSVGTGFTQKTLDALHRLLEPDVRKNSPFAGPVDKKGVTFVEPRFVAEFEFTEWTSDGKLRHPSFKGLREDKEPRQVTREET